jgi:EthD domain
MFKVVWVARFKSGMSREAASAHWTDVHGDLGLRLNGLTGYVALQVPEIDRYVQNRVVASIDVDGVADRPVAFDGFSECWFADRDAYERAVASPPWAELDADGHRLMHMEALDAGMSGVVEERVLLDPALAQEQQQPARAAGR